MMVMKMKSLMTLFLGLLVLQLVTLSLAQENSNQGKKVSIEVRDKNTNALLPNALIKIKSGKTEEEEYLKKVKWVAPSYSWRHDGFKTYTFDTSSNGYNDEKFKIKINESTSLIILSLSKNSTDPPPPPPPPFCGDGVCSGNETAIASSSSRCFDCGRLRGYVALAVGEKQQLPNITISVWADPVNPALFLRNGTSLPPPQFTSVTDVRGFFSINNLSFNDVASSTNQTSGQTKRRFYFLLSGTTIERTGELETLINLLPLWWNIELTNSQWQGFGNLSDTNNSPPLFLYMSPPFSSSEALIRVILSWGTMISNPAMSVPDLDLVVAGPVEPDSIELYGTGIVNFQTKTLHDSNQVIPFVRLVSDSAQGYGPEVMDFYGSSSSSLSLGFSTTYAPGALANAYEIWVDRPNSPPNIGSVSSFLFDTNSFIVVYQNDGTPGGNKQILFDQVTNVPFAFGFSNGDQWNKIPSTATLWHVFDFSQVVGGLVFTGFPGENGTMSTAPGAKYGFDGALFESTKTIPCGHVSQRGANPEYCPATITYPQI